MVLAFAGIDLVPNGFLLFHIAIILLMIFILNKTFFRPINQVLEARERKRKTNITEAEEILLSAKKKREAYDAEMLKVRNEGYKLIENIRKETLAKAQSEIEKAKSEIAEKTAAEKASILRQTEEACKEIQKEVKELAEKISASILK
jgi:F0F1-type ATP synthase membrane subunit b/b'